jgi:hypothetical protein
MILIVVLGFIGAKPTTPVLIVILCGTVLTAAFFGTLYGSELISGAAETLSLLYPAPPESLASLNDDHLKYPEVVAYLKKIFDSNRKPTEAEIIMLRDYASHEYRRERADHIQEKLRAETI